MLTYEILLMLFGELFADDPQAALDAWIASSGYSSSWTDQQIYAQLPGEIKSLIFDLGLNASWMHDGM